MLFWVNSTVGLTIQVFFTYILIYLLMPRYLVREKYISFGASIFVLFFVSIIIYAYGFRYVNPIIESAFGLQPIHWTMRECFHCASDIIFVSGSTAAGIALGIKLIKRWWLKQKETEEILKEKTTAELHLLKARIHPHFLFNSLNNIYSFALHASPRTPGMIQKLSGLLQYMLYECNQPQVPLEKELKMIEDYISLETIRYGARLNLDINIQKDTGHKMIAPLLLIPFVENSFKHGSSKMLVNPEVTLDIHVDEEILCLKLTNNKPADLDEIHTNGNVGLGLKNVKKRLELLYPKRHELQITDGPRIYIVTMKIMLNEHAPTIKKVITKKGKTSYELA